eukprot:TRINITY_DN4438_c0_g1_i4.p1 TRINITY_DN4438_c0_g1~~TRINITY_DN4438_c0_g1_i4.p1  ORF type:complete len:367 (-),score=60.62 TRINITY_DN4438_c0_g1_i4:39-1139(-)
MAARFLEAFWEYEELAEQMLDDMRADSPWEDAVSNEVETKNDYCNVGEKDPDSNKVKICLQIPLFSSIADIKESEDFDSPASGEYFGTKHKQTANKISDFESEKSWRDFFSQGELEDITNAINFNKELTPTNDNPAECAAAIEPVFNNKQQNVTGDEREEMKLIKLLKSTHFVENTNPLNEQRRALDTSVSKTPSPKLYYKYKDLVRINNIRKDNELFDSLNSRLVRIIPNKFQRSFPEKLSNHLARFKFNPSYERGFPSYERPLLGTTCGPSEAPRRPRLDSEARESSPLVPCKGIHELKPTRCGLNRLPSFTTQDKTQRRSHNSNLLKLCVPPLERVKAFQMQCRRSIRTVSYTHLTLPTICSV